jgi:alpha-1,2-mannosyltransferase
MGDTSRVIGSMAASGNQSWRAGISRILGHGAGYGPPVLVALAATAVLALLAWRAVGTSDRLGGIVLVQLFGLLLSPVSWTHHWVWVLPLMIWLFHGPLRERAGARILGWGWLALTGPPWLVSLAQQTTGQLSLPWYLAWAGLAYIAATVITFAWVATTSQRPDRLRPPASNPAAGSLEGFGDS